MSIQTEILALPRRSPSRLASFRPREFPLIPAEQLFAMIIEWGRYAEVLDHDTTAGRVTLMEGA